MGRGKVWGMEWIGVEAALDELYATAPSGFVARREELAKAAKAAGRADDARRIGRARRPTLAAWAANLLVRTRPEESGQFLELGRALREAHRTLDRAELKKLSAQQWRVISAMSAQAARLAHEAGQRLSDPVQREVESTLRAVLADPDAAGRWAAGRLENTLTPPSELPAGGAEVTVAPRKAAPAPLAAPPRRPPARAEDELAERRKQRQERLARARRRAKAAEQELRARRKEQSAAETALQRARDRRERAQRDADAAEERLRQAHDALQRAGQEQKEAEERSRSAADRAARAGRAARDAAREAERLDRG